VPVVIGIALLQSIESSFGNSTSLDVVIGERLLERAYRAGRVDPSHGDEITRLDLVQEVLDGLRPILRPLLGRRGHSGESLRGRVLFFERLFGLVLDRLEVILA